PPWRPRGRAAGPSPARPPPVSEAAAGRGAPRRPPARPRRGPPPPRARDIDPESGRVEARDPPAPGLGRRPEGEQRAGHHDPAAEPDPDDERRHDRTERCRRRVVEVAASNRDDRLAGEALRQVVAPPDRAL